MLSSFGETRMSFLRLVPIIVEGDKKDMSRHTVEWSSALATFFMFCLNSVRVSRNAGTIKPNSTSTSQWQWYRANFNSIKM